VEKGSLHFKLVVVKALIKAGKVRATASALAGGSAGKSYLKLTVIGDVLIVSFKEL